MVVVKSLWGEVEGTDHGQLWYAISPAWLPADPVSFVNVFVASLIPPYNGAQQNEVWPRFYEAAVQISPSAALSFVLSAFPSTQTLL